LSHFRTENRHPLFLKNALEVDDDLAEHLPALQPREAALDYCERWLHSRLPQARMLMLGVRALVYLAFFQHPSVLEAMDVHWDRRMLETIRLRAETLDHAEYGYPR